MSFAAAFPAAPNSVQNVARYLERSFRGECWQTASSIRESIGGWLGLWYHPETIREARRWLVRLGAFVAERLMPGQKLPDGHKSGNGTLVIRVNDKAHEIQARKNREKWKVDRARDEARRHEETAAADRAKYGAPAAMLAALAPNAPVRRPGAPLARRTPPVRMTATELDAALAARPPSSSAPVPEPPDG